MAPRSASTVADCVASRARGLDRFLQRIELLCLGGQLPQVDVERAYSGGFVEFHALVERSIEKLFVGLLRRRYKSKVRGVRGLLTVRSDVVARAILRGERAYVDWLPYGRHTVKRAGAFFASGLPFASLEKTQVDALDDFNVMRNALVHGSRSALRQFRRVFLDGKPLPPREQQPLGYLRGLHAAGQTRMNLLLSRVVKAMSMLAG